MTPNAVKRTFMPLLFLSPAIIRPAFFSSFRFQRIVDRGMLSSKESFLIRRLRVLFSPFFSATACKRKRCFLVSRFLTKSSMHSLSSFSEHGLAVYLSIPPFFKGTIPPQNYHSLNLDRREKQTIDFCKDFLYHLSFKCFSLCFLFNQKFFNL